MAFIVGKQIELSGASSAQELKKLWMGGDQETLARRQREMDEVRAAVVGVQQRYDEETGQQLEVLKSLQDQIKLLADNQEQLMKKIGGDSESSGSPLPNEDEPQGQSFVNAPTGP
jgi:hypothetical protein